MELSVRLTERGRLIQRWRAGLFHPPWARQMGRYALRILTLALQTPGARLCDIELAPPAAVTSEHIGDPTPERVIEQFRSICRASPDRPCLREGTRRFSYGRLERRVTLLARRLKAVGVQPGRPVAVLADRSIETIVAMLAVFAAGAVYLPIDKALPKGRIHAILNDSHPAAALCASEERPLLPAGLPALPLEWKEASRPDPEAFIKYDATGYDDADPAHSAAYLIYYLRFNRSSQRGSVALGRDRPVGGSAFAPSSRSVGRMSSASLPASPLTHLFGKCSWPFSPGHSWYCYLRRREPIPGGWFTKSANMELPF